MLLLPNDLADREAPPQGPPAADLNETILRKMLFCQMAAADRLDREAYRSAA